MLEEKLFIEDSRTSLKYEIPIRNNAIKATSFKEIKLPRDGPGSTRRAQGGLKVLDTGLQNTAVVESKIAFVDGENGVVQYRGHPIEKIWNKCQFEDLAFLFIWGHLPSPKEKDKLRSDLASSAGDIPEAVIMAIKAFPRTSAPIPMMLAGLAAYVGSDPESVPTTMGGNIYHGNLPAVDKGIIRALAAYSVVAGLAACHRANRPFTRPNPDGSYLENFLLMMGIVDANTGKPDPKHVYAIQRTWALSAEHGPTNSTSAFLCTASTLADPLSCLISAVSSAYGPLHFGATEVAYRVIQEVGTVENVPVLIERVKAGEARLFGYGHRIYKTVDPRIEGAKEVLADLDAYSNPLLSVAVEIDRIAASDEYFISRNLNANADLYGVFIYIAINIPPELIPVLMIGSRTAGMLAHWREAMGMSTFPQNFPTPLNTCIMERASCSNLAPTADLHWRHHCSGQCSTEIKAMRIVANVLLYYASMFAERVSARIGVSIEIESIRNGLVEMEDAKKESIFNATYLALYHCRLLT
ncbi:Citrate synthase [Lachnellula suecica]|uniref:Citrate synthase n=1 Tax=Lachnellula suecica TaxID=602035 RepID=A0A8T9CED2_9HELO|nr:Citrate synthase [Lachnellula suecica]